ncbi:MAG: hypothetical protein U0792_11970 [Gemmataceae bacterium]
MTFFMYAVGATDGVTIKSQTELFEVVKKFGFPTNPHEKLCKTIDDVIAYCNEWNDKAAGAAVRHRRHGDQGERLRPA